MKKIFVIFAMFAGMSLNAQWVWQNPIPHSNSIYSVYFLNKFTGWCAGSSGSLMRTTNGGNNWDFANTDTKVNIKSVCFTNNSTGYVIADSSLIYKTTDGGNVWTKTYLGGNSSLNNIAFVDANTGMIIGNNLIESNGIIYRTTNAGLSWSVACQYPYLGTGRIKIVNNKLIAGGNSYYFYSSTDSGLNWLQLNYTTVKDFDFYDSLIGYSVSWGRIKKTTNGGLNFFDCNVSTDTLNSVMVYNENTIFCAGGSKILRSTNAGNNWEYVSSTIPGYINRIFIKDTSDGWAAGEKGLICKSSNTGINWINLSDGYLNDIFNSTFLNKNTGWFTGRNLILKTTNGGSSWINQTIPQQGYYSVSFINENTGYALQGSYGESYSGCPSYKTTNGGNNWTQLTTLYVPPIQYASSHYLYKICFLNENTGFAVGSVRYNASINSFSAGLIFSTINGGLNWSYSTSLSTIYFNDIAFANSSTAWIVGSSATILKTTNSGTNWWTLQSPYLNINYGRVSVVDTNNVFITGYGNNLQTLMSSTTNGGINWTGSLISSNFNLRNICFINNNTGWISGESGLMYATTNRGIQWMLQKTPTNIELNNIFVNDSTGWIFGKDGTILKTTSGVISKIIKLNNEIPEKFHLYQNYPNPFNNSTRIKFQVPVNTDIKISLYDMRGRLLKIITDSKYETGVYELIINGDEYSSGVYFYMLSSSNYIQTKKMVLIK